MMTDPRTNPKIVRALRWVQRGLLDGTLVHVRATHKKLFSMETWGDEDDPACGTPRCIGGWVHYRLHRLGNQEEVDVVCNSSELASLFVPYHLYSPNWSLITPRQAATAIDRFLAGRADLWSHVLRRSTLP